MLVTIDEDKCSACGQCVLEAPDLFDQRDEDGVAVVLAQPSSPALVTSARSAQAACPAAAVVIVD